MIPFTHWLDKIGANRYWSPRGREQHMSTK